MFDGNSIQPRRIAVFRALYLGDLLAAVPAWRALRQACPDAEITLITLPWARELVARLPYIDRLLEFPGYPGMTEVEPDEGRLAAFLAEQRAYGYDLAIQMHGSGEQSAPFTAALGARRTIGYEPHGPARQPCLTVSLLYPGHLPEVQRNLRLVEVLTGRPASRHLEFPLVPQDFADLDALPEMARIPAGARLIGIHPGARPPARRWMPERFAAVMDALTGDRSPVPTTAVIVGAPGEEELAAAIARGCRASSPISLAGRTSLGALAALISRMSLFIGNDSGPAHIATALDTPSVVLFGQADHRRWAPAGRHRHRIVRHPVDCSPCYDYECRRDGRCMRGIEVEQVLAEARDLLAESSLNEEVVRT